MKFTERVDTNSSLLSEAQPKPIELTKNRVYQEGFKVSKVIFLTSFCH